jgi:hypothetical protein
MKPSHAQLVRIVGVLALSVLVCGEGNGADVIVRPYPGPPQEAAKRQLTFETRVAKRFGMKFNVEGRVIQVEPGTPDFSQQRRMYRFFDKTTNADPKEYLKSIELQIHSDRLRAKFAEELKKTPNKLFRLTVYETVFAFGEPGEDDFDVEDELLAPGAGWFAESVLVLRGFRAAEARSPKLDLK